MTSAPDEIVPEAESPTSPRNLPVNEVVPPIAVTMKFACLAPSEMNTFLPTVIQDVSPTEIATVLPMDGRIKEADVAVIADAPASPGTFVTCGSEQQGVQGLIAGIKRFGVALYRMMPVIKAEIGFTQDLLCLSYL